MRDGRTGLDGFEGSPLDPRYTFQSFVVGAPNRLAHAAALQVAESTPDQPLRYNPLYIHARVGMGKTHLLHAVAWEVKNRNPAAKVLYLTAERFMYSFAEALQTRDAPAFKEKLRMIDLLLIDDMEFLQGRTFQQEFCHTLNSLIDGGKQVVVAADCAPLLLESFDARMRSRLSGGLVAELAALDYELRLKILEKRATEKIASSPGFEVPGDVLDYLATQLTENGRELEGAITRLHAAYQLTGEKVTCDAAENTIGDLIRSKEPKRVKIDDILRIVAKHYGVQRGDLLSSRRNQSIVRPRQIGMYLAKTLTSRSLPEIGRRFGGRDHTTVLHAIRKIENLKQQDGTLKEELDSLSRMLKDGTI
jgi:chromosomal replication initiator protein